MSVDAAVTRPMASPDSKSDTPTRLTGRRLLLARLAWFVLTGVMVGLFVLTIPLQIADAQRICTSPVVNDCFNLGQLNAQLLRQLEQMGLSLGFYVAYYIAVQSVFPLVFLGVGALIFWRKSDDWMALLVSLMLVVFGLGTFAAPTKLLPLAYPSVTFPILLLQFLGVVFLMFFIYLFPDGRLVPRWMRWLIPLIVVRAGIEAILPDSDLVNSTPWFGVQLINVALALYAQIYRYRRVSGPVQRQQTKWVVYGLAIAFIGYFGFILLFGLGFTGWTTNVLLVLFLETLLPFFILMIPVSILIAVLRFRLYDIDLLINRTLVYIPLTAILAGLFAASITLSQKLFIALTGQSSDAATVLTTLIVVAAVEPVKTGLQHLVDRRFKEAPDPAKGLKTIRQQAQALLQVIDAETSTERLLEAAVRAFDAKGGAVYLERDGQLKVAHTLGEWSDDPQLSLPLESHGRQLGLLALGARHSGVDYTVQDRETLRQTVEPVAQAISLAGHVNGAGG